MTAIAGEAGAGGGAAAAGFDSGVGAEGGAGAGVGAGGSTGMRIAGRSGAVAGRGDAQENATLAARSARAIARERRWMESMAK